MERLTAFESGFMYVVIEELGNRILVDGMHYDTDISKFIQPKLDIFQENHYSVFDALVSVARLITSNCHTILVRQWTFMS